ncbi:NnrS family protein [Tianweitania sp.]|uniref:NnrS family protein n=1 Tax=Tianweitania sp. TaxID=2021634 RepID=UPI00289CA514|nr:NnrS family protein [Tianweitania sp.]
MHVARSTEGRSLLIFYPAGVFFALSAFMAAMLPWVWLLPLEDPQLAHVRLGLFGFGGLAISGYIMTAQKAWTGRPLPVSPLVLGALALASRLVSLLFPGDAWSILLSLPVALFILLPVLRARRWDKVPLAMVPLLLVGAEVMLLQQRDLAGILPVAIMVLVFIVGGRIVPSFTADARRRVGLGDLHRPPLWMAVVLLLIGLLDEGTIGTLALVAAMLWVMTCSIDGLGLGRANRMLSLGYAGLLPGLLAVVAARFGLVPHLVQVHALTMATMGPMILAIASRVTMLRSENTELQPRRRHWYALGLIFGSAVARALAEVSEQAPLCLLVAGVLWSAAWIVFLSAHVQALMKPAPFPLLSAKRPRTFVGEHVHAIPARLP